jgi:hypothetical protein
VSGEYREGEEEFFDRALLEAARLLWSVKAEPGAVSIQALTDRALDAAGALTLARHRGLERLREGPGRVWVVALHPSAFRAYLRGREVEDGPTYSCVGDAAHLRGLSGPRHRVVVLPGASKREDWAEVRKVLDEIQAMGVAVEGNS